MKRSAPLRRSGLVAKPWRVIPTNGGKIVRFASYAAAERYADEQGGARIDIVSTLRTSPRRTSAARKRCLDVVRDRDGKRCWAALRGAEGACDGPLDGHEILPRGRGGDPDDPDNVRLVCRLHHDWCHDHPADATTLGLLRPTRAVDE